MVNRFIITAGSPVSIKVLSFIDCNRLMLNDTGCVVDNDKRITNYLGI